MRPGEQRADLPRAQPANGGLAGPTILIHLAVTCTVLRVIMLARAQRRPLGGGGPAGSLTSGPRLTAQCDQQRVTRHN